MIGKHNVSNALSAICVGRHFGESDEEIACALEKFTQPQTEWNGKKAM